MNDTSPEVEFRFHTMMMKKSGEDRLKMGFTMFGMARRQVIASISMNKPDADIQEIRKEIFIRFYGQDFSLKEQKKILMHIAKHEVRPA